MRSIVCTTSSVLSRKVDLRMDYAHMTGERVTSGEGLFFNAQGTPHLLFAHIVNSVLVPCQIVRPREDGVAGLSSGWIDALTFVRPCL